MTLKFYLDAGHGGKDSGALGNGLYEKNVVLDLANRVEAKLKEYSNIQVLQTRTTDIFLELKERTDKANQWGADCFVSFHCNSAEDPTGKGFESYIWNGQVGSDTIAFQNLMHQEILRQIGANVIDRGKRRANFHVLRESHMKAILVENLFVSNASDASLLKTATFLDRVAQGYVNGLEKFFGLVKETRPPTVDSPPTGALFQVVAGTYSDRSNAEAQVKKLNADGYNAFIQVKQ